MKSQDSRRPWLIAAIFAVLPLLGFWAYGLFDLDEGFYAAVVAAMNRSHEWITPTYAGHPWYEKPILLYWLAKPSVIAFGHAVGPRLPSVVATLALYGICAWFVARRAGDRAGRLTLAILGTMPLIVGAGRMMLTDPLLDLCFTGAMLAFFVSLSGNRSARLVAAACLGLSVLAKGPVALPLFGAVAGWTYWKEHDLRKEFRGYWLTGTAIFLVVVAAWYLPAYLANGHDFVQGFLIDQNLHRFTGGDEAHRVPFLLGLIYYAPILLVGTLPWCVPFISGYRKNRGLTQKETDLKTGPLTRYLLRWAITVFVFFTLSSTKLPHYILPALPPFGMLVAMWITEWRPQSAWARLAPYIASIVLCIAANAAFLGYASLDHRELHEDAASLKTLIGAAPATVIAYEFPRRERDLGTGRPKIQETSHPSLRFDLDSPNIDVLESEGVEAIEAAAERGRHVFVMTRPGRISEQDRDQLKERGLVLRRLVMRPEPKNYEVYSLDRRNLIGR